MKARFFQLLTLLAALALALGFTSLAGRAAPPPPGQPASPGKTPAAPGGPYDALHRPPALPGQPVNPAAASDPFGYTWDDTAAFQWVDATGGTAIIFRDPDDSFSDPLDIGFNFKFYEKSYTQVYASTNGFVSFGSGSDSFANQTIPMDTPPNNFIAAFWDDLNVGGGTVYYKAFSDGSGKAFVIAYHNAVRVGSSDRLTFEIVLRENGDILLQYLDMNGTLNTASVGIEDIDGLFGLEYVYNAPGVVSGKAVKFTRPPAAARVKAQPAYQSGFATHRQSRFTLTVGNIGELGTDVYNLSAVSNQPQWTVSFYRPDNLSLLTDTNQDGLVDTGPVAQGYTATVSVRVDTPVNAIVSDYTAITLTVASTLNPAQRSTPWLQVAVPAPFAQAYANADNAMLLQQTWQHRIDFTPVVPGFYTGSTLSVAGRENNNYVYAWERNDSKKVGENQYISYSDIEFSIMDRLGRVLVPLGAVTKNSDIATPTKVVNARYPSISAAPGGNFGFTWALYQTDTALKKSNSNIYYAMINASGTMIGLPVNLTNNSNWYGVGDTVFSSYSAPVIAVTGDQRYFLSWIDNHTEPAGETGNVYYAIYSSAGQQLKAPAPYAQSDPGTTKFVDPTLTSLTGNRVIAAYSIYDQGAKTYTLAYAISDSSGNKLDQATTISNTNGWRVDVAQFSSGNILLAWTDATAGRITFAILSEQGQLLSGPTALPLIGKRKYDYVSVTPDQNRHVILTWMDAEWKNYLYYALIQDDGQVSTPPMTFLGDRSANSLVQTSFTGLGNAPYVGLWLTEMPLIKR